MIKPLLAQTYEPHRVTYPCHVQPKLNGIRALYQAGCFQSRDGVPFPKGLLDHLAQPLLRIFGEQHYPLDGELYVHGWSLQRILSAVTPVRGEPTEDTPLIEYHVFDTVNHELPFIKRMQPVWTALSYDLKLLKSVDTFVAPDALFADGLYSDFVAKGYEGMMYRLGDCPYTVPKQPWDSKWSWWETSVKRGSAGLKFLSDKDNRCWHLLKRKDWRDDEFEILGFELTTGAKGEPGFRLHCKTSTNKRFAVSNGLTQTEVQHYNQNQPISRLAKIKYLVLSDEGIPQNTTILAIL